MVVGLGCRRPDSARRRLDAGRVSAAAELRPRPGHDQCVGRLRGDRSLDHDVGAGRVGCLLSHHRGGTDTGRGSRTIRPRRWRGGDSVGCRLSPAGRGKLGGPHRCRHCCPRCPCRMASLCSTTTAVSVAAGAEGVSSGHTGPPRAGGMVRSGASWRSTRPGRAVRRGRRGSVAVGRCPHVDAIPPPQGGGLSGNAGVLT